MSRIGADVGLPLGDGSKFDRINRHQLRDRKRKARRELDRTCQKAHHQATRRRHMNHGISVMPSSLVSLMASRKAKRAEDRERRRNRIRRNGLQLLVGAAGFHEYGENVADRNGGFVKGLDRYIPQDPQRAEASVATGLSNVSADARLLMRAFNNGSQPAGAHDSKSEDEEVAIRDEDSSHLRGGGFSSSCSSTIGGESEDWTEESETTDGSMSELESFSVFDVKVDEGELAQDVDETVEEMVGHLFDGDLIMPDTMRQQTKIRLRDRLLGQELARTTERRMRRGGVIGGNAGRQDQAWRASNTVNGADAIISYKKNAPRNIIFPTNPTSPVAPDGWHGYQAQNPDANLCYPLQWRMFHGLDSNWVIRERDSDLNTDNYAAANNEKHWAFERSIALAKNYIPFNGQGHNGDIESYPLQTSADLIGAGVRPLTLAPRDTELLSILDPATSVQYAFEHPRMSLGAQTQSQRDQKLSRFKPGDYIDSRLRVNPNTPTPPPQEPLQAAGGQQQSEVDAQLHGETGTSWDALANPNKGLHDPMNGKEKPPFPISPPLPVDYSPFAQAPPQRANERAAFPMSPVPSADKLFHGQPTSVWKGRSLFEGLSAAAEPVRLHPMERSEKGPFLMSPALNGPRLTPSEPPTPSAIFGSPAAPLDAVAAARKQNEAWVQGPIPGLPPAAPNSVTISSGVPISEKNKTAQAHAVPAAPGPPGPFVDMVDVTPDTAQDVVLTTPDWEHEAAHSQAATAGGAGAGHAVAEGGGDAPEGRAGLPPATPLLESAVDGDSKATAYPVTTPKSGRGDGDRVLMPTVPQTRRVANKAIRAACGERSLPVRGRKPED